MVNNWCILSPEIYDLTVEARAEDPTRPLHSDGLSDPAFRTTISYIDRSRVYYAKRGFDVPYRWAKHESVPFVRPRVPVDQARVAIVTTAKQIDPLDDTTGTQSNRLAPFAVACDPVPRLSTDGLSWHTTATHTDDPGSYLPVAALAALAEQGVVGQLNDRLFGVPTVYSHRRTASYASTVSRWCREDGVDIAVLVPI